MVHDMDLDLDLDLVHDLEENFKGLFQRNDADIVGVRRGCKFSAWTEVISMKSVLEPKISQVGFRGERFDLIAKESER